MGELGAFAEEAHREVGSFARAHGIERMFAVGALAQLTVQSFGAGAEGFADTDRALEGTGRRAHTGGARAHQGVRAPIAWNGLWKRSAQPPLEK